MLPKLGIVGGMGSFASMVIFEKIIRHAPSTNDRDYPEIFLHNNSAVPDRTQAILYEGKSPLPELKRSFQYMESCGVDYIIMACITAHYFHDELSAAFPQSHVLNILNETIHHIQKQTKSFQRVGILASTGTVNMRLWQNKLEEVGIESVTLSEEDQEELIMKSIYGPSGLKQGVVSPASKTNFLNAAQQLEANGAQAIIGGCSEVPMVLSQDDIIIPLFDSIQIVVERYFASSKKPSTHAS